MKQIALHWGTEVPENLIGNGYGYRTHNEELRAAVEKIAVLDENAKDVLIVTSPEFYQRIPGKRNWLFTMFEESTIPEKFQSSISQADILIAPTNWAANVLRAHFPQPVHVVPHGVDPAFTYIPRRFPVDEPFRFLWVGAPNPRKGWEEITNVWQSSLFTHSDKHELYLKTTRVGKVEKRGNVTLDGRNLDRSDLINLYHSAHCFVLPTRGEGFGLTLAEAMATGLPCIATGYSGVTQFFDERTGYPISYKMGKGLVSFVGDSTTEVVNMAYPDPLDLYEKMRLVLGDYKNALLKGKRASERIKGSYTWDRAAQKLVSLIQEYGG